MDTSNAPHMHEQPDEHALSIAHEINLVFFFLLLSSSSTAMIGYSATSTHTCSYPYPYEYPQRRIRLCPNPIPLSEFPTACRYPPPSSANIRKRELKPEGSCKRWARSGSRHPLVLRHRLEQIARRDARLGT